MALLVFITLWARARLFSRDVTVNGHRATPGRGRPQISKQNSKEKQPYFLSTRCRNRKIFCFAYWNHITSEIISPKVLFIATGQFVSPLVAEKSSRYVLPYSMTFHASVILTKLNFNETDCDCDSHGITFSFFREVERWRKRARNGPMEFASFTWQSAISTGAGGWLPWRPTILFLLFRRESSLGRRWVLLFRDFSLISLNRPTDTRAELGPGRSANLAGLLEVADRPEMSNARIADKRLVTTINTSVAMSSFAFSLVFSF